jgi:hypothetical protein
MSLIPSESHSFPDNYSPVACSRKAKRKNLSQTRPAIEAQQRNIVPLPGPARETRTPSPSPGQSPVAQFFQSLGKLAEQGASPLPQQNEEILPEPNGEITPPAPSSAASPIAQFFQSLEKLAETNGAPLAAPRREIIPPSPPAGQNVGEQIFQSLQNLADSSAPPPPMEPPPRRLPIAPIRRGPRPPVAPISPENVDEASLLTANGRGRAPQYRPKTPIRIAKPVAMVPTERPAPEVVRQQATQSFAQQPHDEFDFVDVSADVERSSRRHQKFTRFILIEIIALVVLIPSAWLVLSRHVTSPAMVLLMNILTIAAAVTMAVVPIVLYALAPGFGRPER